MNKYLTPFILAFFVAGCSTLTVPSFNDVNQSKAAVDIQMAVHNIKCENDDLPQAANVYLHIMWYETYSNSRGGQKDMLKILTPIKETTYDWIKRAEQAEPSEGYCKIKKDLLKVQSEALAKATIRRF